MDGEVEREHIERPPKPGVDYYGGPIKIAGVPDDAALPTQPIDEKQAATIRIPLAGKKVVRFKATLGGDYPFGDESQRRKVYSIRSRGEEARFLTVLEPYESKAMVKVATATGPDSLRVELADGRMQEIVFSNLDKPGRPITVQITESRDGKMIRTEQAGDCDSGH